jgi:hypothetical protein
VEPRHKTLGKGREKQNMQHMELIHIKILYKIKHTEHNKFLDGFIQENAINTIQTTQD